MNVGNNIGDKGAIALANALPTCNKLEKLWLDGNKITEAGRAELACAVANHPALKDIR